MPKKILVVASEFPFPNDSGGRYDVYRRLETLNKLGFTIDLLYTNKIEIRETELLAPIQQLVRQIYFCKKNLSLINLFSFFPFQVKSRDELKKIEIDECYDVAILEGEYVGFFFKNTKIKIQNFFLRVNNNEATFFFAQAKSEGFSFKAIYLLSDAIKFIFYSKKIFKYADKLLFVNYDELKKAVIYSSNKEKNKYIHFLSHHDVAKFKTQSLTGSNVLFIGSLTLESNFSGIKWFIENVHEHLLCIPDYKLIVVGSTLGDIKIIESLKRFSKIERLQIETDVKDIGKYYENAAIFINPVKLGAGIKVKTINAIQNGLPVISTNCGAEGIGLTAGKDYYEANTSPEFQESIRKLLENKEEAFRFVNAAQTLLRTIHHEEVLHNLISVT